VDGTAEPGGARARLDQGLGEGDGPGDTAGDGLGLGAGLSDTSGANGSRVVGVTEVFFLVLVVFGAGELDGAGAGD